MAATSRRWTCVLFKDVAHEDVHVCMEPSQARHLLDRAVRTAYAARSVTCIIVPEDVQESEHSEPPRVNGATYSGGGLSAARVAPAEEGPAPGGGGPERR